MPNTAFYRVLTDSKVLDLPGDGSSQAELTFETTNDLVEGVFSASPLLCCEIDPTSQADITLRVKVRNLSGADKTITTRTLTDGATRFIMEPFDAEWLRQPEDNAGPSKLIFDADIRSGNVRIRNVVVMFMRDT